MIIKANSLYIPLKNESINCVMTSPPYWGLRKYDIPDLVWDGVEGCEHEWGDEIQGKVFSGGIATGIVGSHQDNRTHHDGKQGHFCLLCSAWRGQLGLEPTIELYLSHLLQITKEIWRVLRKDGVFFINIGDSYYGGKGRSSQAWSTEHQNRNTLQKSQHQICGFNETRPSDLPQDGLKPKDLCLIPFRLALALQAQGWWVRSDIIWSKPNPMPESVKDRPTRSHEYLFLLTKSQHYFWDAEAVKERCESGPSDIKKMEESLPRIGGKHKVLVDPFSKASSATNIGQKRSVGNPSGRNLRSVWTIATQPFSGAHYAVFPEELVERCIKAGCPKEICVKCGKAREKIFEQGELLPDAPQYKPRGKNKPEWNVKTAMTPAGSNQGHPNFHYEKIDRGYTDCGCKILTCKQCGMVLEYNQKTEEVEHHAKDLPMQRMPFGIYRQMAKSQKGTDGLLKSLCWEMGQPKKEDEPSREIRREDKNLKGIHSDLESQSSELSERLCNGASLGNRKDDRQISNEGRGGKSQKWDQEGQSRREFGIDEEETTRWSAETTIEDPQNNLPPLQDSDFSPWERCPCCGNKLTEENKWRSGVCLDPFAGSGTVQRVAEKLGRMAIGLDLGYQDLQKKRTQGNQVVLPTIGE